MSENIVLALFNGFTLLIILLTQILIPRITRKDILLGIKIPEGVTKTDEVKSLIKGFTKDNLIVGIPLAVIFSILTYYIENVNLFVYLVFLYILILFFVYLKWNKNVKELKKEKDWGKVEKKVVVVDTKFSKDRGKKHSISKKWFLIPITIILINIVLSLVLYPSLPDRVPTHWNLSGEVDGWMDKSIGVALLMPFTMIFLAIIIYGSYYFMLKSRAQIKSKNPELSLKKNIIFRNAWSIFFIVTLTLIEIQMTISNLQILGVIENSKLFGSLNFIIPGIIIVGAIGLGLVVGQGGDRLKISEDKEKDEDMEYDIDDDKLWKLGNTIYYNPDDSSLFVEKRVGIGWTVNAGRPLGMAIIIIPFIIVIFTLFLV